MGFGQRGGRREVPASPPVAVPLRPALCPYLCLHRASWWSTSAVSCPAKRRWPFRNATLSWTASPSSGTGSGSSTCARKSWRWPETAPCSLPPIGQKQCVFACAWHIVGPKKKCVGRRYRGSLMLSKWVVKSSAPSSSSSATHELSHLGRVTLPFRMGLSSRTSAVMQIFCIYALWCSGRQGSPWVLGVWLVPGADGWNFYLYLMLMNVAGGHHSEHYRLRVLDFSSVLI